MPARPCPRSTPQYPCLPHHCLGLPNPCCMTGWEQVGTCSGQQPPTQVGPRGLFWGLSSVPAGRRAPDTFPSLLHAKCCCFPSGRLLVTRGAPTCTPIAPYPGIFLAGGRTMARSLSGPSLKPKSPSNKIPRAPLRSSSPLAAPVRVGTWLAAGVQPNSRLGLDIPQIFSMLCKHPKSI